MTQRAAVRFPFAAGHRLLDYQGKCASPHGHTFVAELVVEGDLNALGLVADFTDLKAVAGNWIRDHWDHGFLVNQRDTALLAALGAIPEAKVYQTPGNPSAEHLAALLLAEVGPLLPARLVRVRVWESDTQYGEALP